MKIDRWVFGQLIKKIGTANGVYSAIRRKEKKIKHVKPEILAYAIAVEKGIKISKLPDEVLEKVGKVVEKFEELKDPSKKKIQKEIIYKKSKENDPYKLSLSKYKIHPDLVKECKIRKPYHKEINNAVLNLEVFMRKKMGLDETCYGVQLVTEAKKSGVFKRKLRGEEEGLYFLFSSAFLWIRNEGSHTKRDSGKEDCLKIILFIDYLINLFEKLYDKNISI